MTQAAQRITYRKRNGKQFVAFRVSMYQSALYDWMAEIKPHMPESFCTYEHLAITTPGGNTFRQKHVLWVPQDGLEAYRQWQDEQYRLAQNVTRLEIEEPPGLQLTDLTFEETQRPVDRPVQKVQPVVKKEPKPPPWLTMPSVIRDGNGKEYHWNTLSTTPPVQEQEAPIQDPVPLPIVTNAPEPQKQSGSTGHKGITRQDYDTRYMHGYRVSVTWKRATKSKFFSDGRYGDRLAALAAAIEWRNATEKKLGKPRTEHLIMGIARSNTGYQGIYEGCKDNRYHVFEVYWLDGDNKVHTASISIDRHGRKEALRMAKRLRLQKAKERIRSNEGKKY